MGHQVPRTSEVPPMGHQLHGTSEVPPMGYQVHGTSESLPFHKSLLETQIEQPRQKTGTRHVLVISS